jgi:two-component system, sensor histidine kinase
MLRLVLASKSCDGADGQALMAKRRSKSPKHRSSSGKRTSKRAARVARKRNDSSNNASVVETALAAFAHDVRTPLTGILALAELLAASELGERERTWVATLKSTAEHLASLTNLVVDSVRAEAKGLTPRRDLFDPRRVAESAAALFSARATAKGLTAKTAVAADLPARVYGDPLRLRVALENLLDNAIKFTEQGEVSLTVDAAASADDQLRLIFSVSDSGIGMTPAEIKRLFKPFAQASEDIAKRFGGAGLGLAFVKQLSRALGGELVVESSPGRGSTFRLVIAVERTSETANADDGSDAGLFDNTAAAAPPLQILCVEDNPFGRVVMNTVLTQLGHRIDFLASGDAAVEAIKHGSYDLVLMDVKLSGPDGLEATRRIRALAGAAGRIPIIGVSGHARLADANAARRAGMDAFLAKPVSPKMLADAIGKVVAR